MTKDTIEVVMFSLFPFFLTNILKMRSRYNGMELRPNVIMGERTADQLTPMTEGRGASFGDKLNMRQKGCYDKYGNLFINVVS